MLFLKSKRILGVASLSMVLVSLAGFGGKSGAASREGVEIVTDPRVITILATNDMHGSVEPAFTKDGKKLGGMSFWAGIVSSIRKGIEAKNPGHAGVLVVDAGDQFQGTLMSNFNEGQLMFSAMNEVGYDAVVPGNHDYDFGPIGWLEDQVTPGSADQNPRGALLRLAGKAKFPLLSANTYYKKSLLGADGAPVEVSGQYCKPVAEVAIPTVIQWSQARRPEFLQPYVIREVAGVRVALIGLDHPETPLTTTAANVSDLCFRDPMETYLEIHAELNTKADLFVMIIHDGNPVGASTLSKMIEGLLKNGPVVDAVVAGHTHVIHNVNVGGVPIIQSGANGTLFGRIDLVWDQEAKKVDASQIKSNAGVGMYYESCAPQAASFCAVSQTGPEYEGRHVTPSAEVEQLIADGRAQVAPVAGRVLGTTEGVLNVDRISESPLANALTDTFRALSGADITFMNTGGIRTSLPKGEFTYENLFRVLPFANHGVSLSPMSSEKVLALLNASIQTCGVRGALMQSGLRVEFARNCKTAGGGLDPTARLLRVETMDGALVYDEKAPASVSRSFVVGTLDFLATGGSGYEDFKGVPQIGDVGVLREAMTEYYLKHPAQFSTKLDGRWQER
ncbi:bifunctional UDP-sugar hydrolase/5'-nucleotidase [Bdellovibrionota bacterium FG-2]